MWFQIAIATVILLMNGVEPAPQTTPDTQCGPMDVVFLLDSSQKVNGKDFDKQLEFANSIVDRLDIGPGRMQTRVGVISIGYSYMLEFYLRTHTTKEGVKKAINRISHHYFYETNTGSSIRFMTLYMFRSFFGGRKGATRVAIVITDGRSQDAKSTRYEALMARKKGIKMFAIGVGVKNPDELLSIGSKPTDNYVFTMDSFDDLPSVVPHLPKSACEVSAMTTRRPTPTKRFTFPPLNFDAIKFVPTKTRSPIAVSSVTSARSTRAKIPATSVTISGLPTTPASSSESTTNRPTVNTRTTTDSQSQDKATNHPSTPAPTTRSPESSPTTTNIPSTPEPTTRGPKSSTTTTSIPSTSEPTTRRLSNQPSELVSPGSLSLSNEPVEINNAPTKQISETKGTYYKKVKKLYKKKKYLERMSTGNDISNVLSGNNGKWAPAPRNQMNDLQHDTMMEDDRRIWSMMMGSPTEAPFRFNKLSRDIPIADEPKQYCGGKNADVFFALDSSNSIWPEDFRKQIEFITSLVDTFDFRNNKTRVGVIVYSTEIYMKVSLQSGWTRDQIKRQIGNIEYVSGLTNTSDAIRFIRSYGFTEENAREDAIKIAIILTDGISRDPSATKRESILSRADGIKLFAIGIGTDVDETELKRIANDPDDKYVFHVSSFGALASIRSAVAVSACGVVPDQPSNLIYCGADSLADVIFVYDAPGLGARKARLLTSFVHDVTRGLQTTSGRLRIGRRSDNCPSSNIELTTDTNLRAFSNIMFPGIETLLGQLRMAFPNTEDGKNLAVVFVDESTQNIELASRVLKDNLNFHVMVVAIGDMSLARVASDLASLPHTNYLMNIPSYMSLGSYRYELLQKLCFLITTEPMYLRDARVRDTRDL